MPSRSSICEGCCCSQDLALKLEKDYVPTVAVELVVWPVWQLYTFRHVPLQHQLMTSNLLTLGEAVALPLAKTYDGWLDRLPSPFDKIRQT